MINFRIYFTNFEQNQSIRLDYQKMKIYEGLNSFKKLEKAVVTTGTFDGVHLGHKKILNKLTLVAQESNSETILVTFFPHPRIVLFPDQDLKLINTIEENINVFKKCNIVGSTSTLLEGNSVLIPLFIFGPFKIRVALISCGLIDP